MKRAFSFGSGMHENHVRPASWKLSNVLLRYRPLVSRIKEESSAQVGAEVTIMFPANANLTDYIKKEVLREVQDKKKQFTHEEIAVTTVVVPLEAAIVIPLTSKGKTVAYWKCILADNQLTLVVRH